MTREEARTELLNEGALFGRDISDAAHIWWLLVSERIARRKAEARVKELEEQVKTIRNAALEEAAKAADPVDESLAAVIRNMKEPRP